MHTMNQPWLLQKAKKDRFTDLCLMLRDTHTRNVGVELGIRRQLYLTGKGDNTEPL
jgi:hypothetical protein